MILAAVLGLGLIYVSLVYWTHTAGHLPTWYPGYTAGSTHIHTKHAIAALLLGLACFVLAWFQSGPKTSGTGTPPKQ